MDSESLDRCIQTALAALYPPFQATSPTVLCQVLNVVEHCYRGDGLRYLIHFLLPAKQLLQNIQQDACLQYGGLLFRHQGWPLCVHEKVVVQLCPVDQRLLRPGDFYLLVSPAAAPPQPRKHSASCRGAAALNPRLLLCSVSAAGQHVEQQEVSEIALRSLFSMAWLDSVNREKEQRGVPRLERCLLSAHGDVFRVPWEDLVYPQFISQPRTTPKEDKGSSMEDGNVLNRSSHDRCGDTNSSSQDVRFLPSSTKINQSHASSEGEDSEGEYVELTELPRFSPQKGSLTQSISLQHRARTTTHTATHTPLTTSTHSAVSTHTPLTANTHSAVSTHTPLTANTHSAVSTHTPLTANTHSAVSTHTPLTANTHSAVSTHTPLTANAHSAVSTHTPLTANTHSAVSTHTPLTANTHSAVSTHTPPTTNIHSAVSTHTPPTTNIQPAPTTHAGGTTPSSLPCVEVSSHTRLCSRLIEENLSQVRRGSGILTPASSSAPQEVEGTSSGQSEQAEGTGSGRCLSLHAEHREEREHETVASVCVGDEKVQEEGRQQLGEAKCWRDEDEGEETEGDGEEGLDEVVDNELEEGAEEVEVEEEVRVIIVQQSQEIKEEKEQVMKDLRRGEEEERGCGEAHIDKDSYSENNTQQTHSKDSYFEKKTQHMHSEDSCCRNTPLTRPVDSYCEKKTQNTHSKDSYCENNTETQSKDSYCEKKMQNMHSGGSYCENNTQQTQAKDSYSENNTQQTQAEDSYFENNTQTQAKDSYCEKKTQNTHSEDSYSENNTQQTQAEDSYFENNTQTQAKDSYCEKKTQNTHSEDSYCENSTQQSQSKDSYCENTLLTHAVNSYFENNTNNTCLEDSYSESSTLTHPEDSYSEKKTQHTHPEDSYSEKKTQHTHPEDSYSEKKTQHTHPEDSHYEGSKLQRASAALEASSHRHCEENDAPQSVSMVATRQASLWTDTEESDGGQDKQEEKKEEEDEEEAGGGRTSERHTEGLCSELPSAGPSLTKPEPPPAAPQLDHCAAPTVPVQLSQSSQSSQSRFYSVLLRSAAVCLPGSRDRGGRALLTFCTTNSVWSNPDCDSAEVLRLLLYYTSTLRKEAQTSGLTVLVDARRAAPAPALFSAIRALQEDTPGSIHTVLILANKDSSLRLDKPAATQVEVLSSLKSVQKHVELRQLPAEFGGSFSFSQSSWVGFRSRVEQLTNQCEDVINLLQKTINILQSTPLPAAAEEAELLLSRYKAVMRSILEDSRLVQLQQEGGASLSRLRREEGGVGVTEDQRAAVETVSSLYDQVDELLHRLVTLSNSRTQDLNFIVGFRSLEHGFSQVRSWLEEVGEVRLKSLEEPEDSLELLNRKQHDFKDFYTTAFDYCKQGEALLSRVERWDDVPSADLHVYEVKVHSFWAQLQDFSQRVNSTGHNIERAVQLYCFLDQAYGWALEGMRHLAGVSMEECTLPDKCQAVIGCLEDYHCQHPPIPDARFQEMKEVAGELRGERGLRQWSFAWSKCQETKKMFDRKMEVALRTRDSAHRRRSDSALSRSSASSRKTLSGLWGIRETSSSSSLLPEEDTSPPTPQHTPLLQRLFRSSSSEESSDRGEFCSSGPSLPRLASSPNFSPSSACSSSSSSFSSSRRQQLRKTQSFDCPSTPEVSRCGPCPRALSEPVRRGNTGVFIRGLEVSSTEAADHTLCPRTPAPGWAGQGLRSPRIPGTPRNSSTPAADARPRGSKLRHIVEEMVTTEQEYVRSLRYIIHHYFPEMDRADLPQDLRGKRSVVFGNLEKLLDFHSQFFLKELEACWKHPLRAPHCFLRHQEQFGLYALYSKNKPKSDTLLANHGHAFFRRKQLELGDKMDLSSYLLKPVQRMSKYALLLTDLMKEVGVAQEAELVALQAATDMVKFQLRHGNDLLAMDAIKDCDVNLKEQGQLIRQDEFTVCAGRRKCQRHVFLFEELVLFSKPKKVEGGLDVFIYKHSFKTADVGLTESTGDSGLRFEIWFRRRTSKNQTFILQAATADVKHAWTSDIARILWTQATRNKEMRLKEMVSMGVGSKPFLDIQPSDAAISDRAVHYIMKSRGARTRASIAVSVFDHSNPFKRGTMTSDPAVSGPSSSSLLGPLNLHMYSQTFASPPSAETSFSSSCIEEDEQEHETSSQPSMTTESSGSSSRCLSGSTGSDSGCVSSHLQEALPEEPSQPSSSSSSSPSKQRLSSQYISPKAAAVISPATIV